MHFRAKKRTAEWVRQAEWFTHLTHPTHDATRLPGRRPKLGQLDDLAPPVPAQVLAQATAWVMAADQVDVDRPVVSLIRYEEADDKSYISRARSSMTVRSAARATHDVSAWIRTRPCSTPGGGGDRSSAQRRDSMTQ